MVWVQLQAGHQEDHIEWHGYQGARDEGVQLVSDVSMVTMGQIIVRDVHIHVTDVLNVINATSFSPSQASNIDY